MIKRIVCLVVSVIILTSSRSTIFAYAAPDEFENEIKSIICQLEKMENLYDKNTKEYEDLQNLITQCKILNQEYSNYVNCMFEGLPFVPDANVSKSEDLNKYIECVKKKITEDPNLKNEYVRDINNIQQTLQQQTTFHQKLFLETQTAFNKFSKTVEEKNIKSDLDKIIVNLDKSINLFQDLDNTFNKNINMIKCEYSLKNYDIINYIYECMKTTNVDNINRLKTVYPFVEKKYQILIYKHLVVLKNFGNKLAFNATYELKGEPVPEFNISCIDTQKEITKDQQDRIFEDNEKLDKEFADIISNFEKSTSGKCDDKFFEKNIIKQQAIGNIKLQGTNFIADSNLLGNSNITTHEYFWYKKNFKYQNKNIPDFGWKIHVTARPSSAKKIFETVVPYLEQNNIQYKTCSSISALRCMALGDNTQTQHGKFITIYPESDYDSNKISKDIDALILQKLESGELSKSDFCELIGDAQIGETGAVFSRYGAYVNGAFKIKDNLVYKFTDERLVPIVRQRINELDAQGCPFDLPVSFLGQRLNKINDKEISDVWNDGTSLIVRKIFQGNYGELPLLLSEYAVSFYKCFLIK